MRRAFSMKVRAADLLGHRLLPRRAGRFEAHPQGTHPAVAQRPTRIQRGQLHGPAVPSQSTSVLKDSLKGVMSKFH